MDKKRLLLLGTTLTLGFAGACCFPLDCLMIENQHGLLSDAIGVYSVLFVLAITGIIVVGWLDNVLIGLSWKQLALYRAAFENQMLRQVMLGCLCLTVITLGLVLQVVPKDGSIYFWGGKLFVFLAIISLLCSFATPFSLRRLYIEKYDCLMLEKGAPSRP